MAIMMYQMSRDAVRRVPFIGSPADSILMRNSQLCVAAAILVIAAVLAAIPAASADAQGSGGLVYETSDDGTASVAGYTGDPCPPTSPRPSPWTVRSTA